MNSALITPTLTPNTSRPRRPAGTVRGSVIMKNRKIIVSGDDITVHQKSASQTGCNDQAVTMQWPARARAPREAPSVAQNAAAISSSSTRLVISTPPMMMRR